MTKSDADGGDVRLPWARSDRRLPRLLVRPLTEFLETETSSGILLVGAAAIALVWANLWQASYEGFWHTELSVELGPWSIHEDLRHWINDALMALFFFVVGLEIKREVVSGELRDPRAIALPAAAALGGMIVPAGIYLAFNPSGAGAGGWGIPMATDIAFALGVLAVVGRRLPQGLKLFLLTLAIIDDIGAIVVIAIFYTDSVSLRSLVAAVLLLGLTATLRRLQVRAGPAYLLLGVGVWLAVFSSGVHATIAGVAIAFVTPAVAFQRPRAVSVEARRVADETSDEPNPEDTDAPQWLHLASLSRDAVSPLARLERSLHPVTSFVVVPLFALANAGVRLGEADLGSGSASRVALGVGLGLLVGKTAGITAGAALATRLGLARLPKDVRWEQVVGVAAVGGIGFTVSLFIAGLAFTDVRLLDAAKVGIFAGSILSGVAGASLLARARR